MKPSHLMCFNVGMVFAVILAGKAPIVGPLLFLFLTAVVALMLKQENKHA